MDKLYRKISVVHNVNNVNNMYIPYVKIVYIFLLSIVFTKNVDGMVFEENMDPVIFMDTPELIRHWGYGEECHTIETEDNYILTMHRIPNPNSSFFPLIVQHGILLASDSWVLRGPKEDLVLLLADYGFDIWLANTRGNKYSINHTLYSVYSSRFWEFGWNELGIFDIPAMVKYIKKITGAAKVIHMGHSMGTTSLYVMLSTLPWMNDQIIGHISLAPVAFMDHLHLKPYIPLLQKVLILGDVLNLNDIYSRNTFLSSFLLQFCNRNKINRNMCMDVFFFVVGHDAKQFKIEYFNRFLGHFPSGTSMRMFIHFAQNTISGDFRKYDYGPELNVEKYGQLFPPKYNLSKISSPIYLYHSRNDHLSHTKDVDKLKQLLPNVKKTYLVPYNKFNHLDFIYAIDSMKLLYYDIINTLKTMVRSK